MSSVETVHKGELENGEHDSAWARAAEPPFPYVRFWRATLCGAAREGVFNSFSMSGPAGKRGR